MVIEDLIGKELTHKTLGKFKVTDVIIDYSNMSSAIVVCENPNKTSKFKATGLFDFFTDVPEELRQDIESLKQEEKTVHDITALKDKKPLKVINEDEFGNELTIDDWKRSKRFVVNVWWS